MQLKTVTLRRNERLQYWRHRDLGDATLLKAQYGPFRWEKHVHDEQVIVVSESGAGECSTRRGSDIGGAGTVWIFAPGEYHCGHVNEGETWSYRALYLDDAALGRIANNLGTRESAVLLKPGLHHDPELARLLLLAHKNPHNERAPEQVAWDHALALLYERYGDPPKENRLTLLGNGALRIAREYIAAHFRDDLSIEDIARICGVSRYHFMRAFHAKFGLPPHAYINQVRLQHARKLLLSGCGAAEAAADAGFYDQSRLNALFKRAYGVTPGLYARLATV